MGHEAVHFYLAGYPMTSFVQVPHVLQTLGFVTSFPLTQVLISADAWMNKSMKKNKTAKSIAGN